MPKQPVVDRVAVRLADPVGVFVAAEEVGVRVGLSRSTDRSIQPPVVLYQFCDRKWKGPLRGAHRLERTSRNQDDPPALAAVRPGVGPWHLALRRTVAVSTRAQPRAVLPWSFFDAAKVERYGQPPDPPAVSETSEPVLVYTRIEANKRTTRLLLASFALVLPPVVSTAVLFVMPWVAFPVYITVGAIWGHSLAADQVLLTGAALIVSLCVVVFCLVGLAGFLIDDFGSRMILRTAHALPVTIAEEPELVRVVENLCIAAGLPKPAVHVVESAAPNALATGKDPSDASIVITRGLLTLLDRRELAAVVAHELSHIGNHDIRLSTTLATLVTIACLPLKVLAILTSLFAAYVFIVRGMFSEALVMFPSVLFWWNVHAIAAPVYAVFLSPVFALLIRTAVYGQREFLADADATLLTRDPEALALALVKVGSARGEQLQVGEGVVHLCFVDPVSLVSRLGIWWPRLDASLLHRIFPSHPPLAERIALLARMGSGIGGRALEAALTAGAKVRQAELELEPVDVPAGRAFSMRGRTAGPGSWRSFRKTPR